jgi:hypothetical protein
LHFECDGLSGAHGDEEGCLITTNDPIKQVYYMGNEDDDAWDNPYKDLALIHKIEQKRRQH